MNNTTNNTGQENNETKPQPSKESSNTEELGKVRNMNSKLEDDNNKEGNEDDSKETPEQNTPAQKEKQKQQLGGNSKNSQDN